MVYCVNTCRDFLHLMSKHSQGRTKMLEIISVVVILLLGILHYSQKSGSGRNLPGPSGVPFFGVIFQIDLNRLYIKLYEWTSSYGDIFQFSIFGKPYVSLNSADLIREVLGTEPNATITASREPSFLGEYCLENFSDVIFSPYSQEWSKRRKLVHRLLHSYGEGIQILENDVLQKLQRVKLYLAGNEGKDVDPHGVVEEFLFENLASLVNNYFM